MTWLPWMLAGIGIGFALGILFARWDQGKVFDLITTTSDKLVTSALYPGLQGLTQAQPRNEEPAQEMYKTHEEDEHLGPDWINEEGAPWDYSSQEEEDA